MVAGMQMLLAATITVIEVVGHAGITAIAVIAAHSACSCRHLGCSPLAIVIVWFVFAAATITHESHLDHSSRNHLEVISELSGCRLGIHASAIWGSIEVRVKHFEPSWAAIVSNTEVTHKPNLKPSCGHDEGNRCLKC